MENFSSFPYTFVYKILLIYAKLLKLTNYEEILIKTHKQRLLGQYNKKQDGKRRNKDL